MIIKGLLNDRLRVIFVDKGGESLETELPAAENVERSTAKCDGSCLASNVPILAMLLFII